MLAFSAVLYSGNFHINYWYIDLDASTHLTAKRNWAINAYVNLNLRKRLWTLIKIKYPFYVVFTPAILPECTLALFTN